MTRYADVTLPSGPGREFTYIVPPELERAALVGTRAVVPFGRRYATGLITALPEETSVRGLKPMLDVLDPAPVLPEELLRVCRWIASYYLSPLGDVLKAAMPHGFPRAGTRVAHATQELTSEALAELQSRAPKQAALAAFILERGRATTAELKRATGFRQVNGLLNEIARAGLATMEETIPRTGVKPRTVELVRADRPEPLREALGRLSARSVKTRALIQELIALAGGPHRPELRALLKRTGASLGQFRALERSGIIVTERVEITREEDYGTEQATLTIVPNDAQKRVLATLREAIEAAKGGTFLLHGVTGSGKTQVYIEAIRVCLAQSRSAIVLVPEISLTPQMVRRFKSHFGVAVAVFHSRMSAGERQDAWRRARRGEARIVIGPRSAVFAPLEGLGLIVVDEEQEASYKQYDAMPRYHARDVAVFRAGHAGAVALLGSATPSVETYQNALTGKYTLLEMPERIDRVPMPAITVVDMTGERKRAYARAKEALPPAERAPLKRFTEPLLSELLREKIRDRLERREGVILLQNRRGFAPFVECPECGYAEMCDNCNVALTYHLAQQHLRCHYCGLVRRPRLLCPTCGGSAIALRGIGTQKVEQEIARLFPAARLRRMDLDTTTRKGSHARFLREFEQRDTDILLGTQMVAKGLDFPHVTLVGVISADTQMLLPDFRASERTFQLLTQVAGRAGRSALTGEVIIQTHQRGHPALARVVDGNAAAFYEEELCARRELDYPPFSHLVLVETRGENEERVSGEAERFARALRRAGTRATLLGPAPAVIGRIDRNYRWHLILKSRKEQDPSLASAREALRSALGETEGKRPRDVRVTIDVDPSNLM